MIPLTSKSIIIAVLSKGYATGAEIIRRVKDEVGMQVQVGSIYPAMAILEEEGLIRVRKRGGRKVKGNVYELSTGGRKRFRTDKDTVGKLYLFDTIEPNGRAASVSRSGRRPELRSLPVRERAGGGQAPTA